VEACLKATVRIDRVAEKQGNWRGPRGPYAGTAARKKEILRAALDVFGRRGYRNGSLREIAERVGLTQAGLIHHFGSKLGLFMEVLHTHAQEAAWQTRLPFREEVLAVVDDSESNRDYIRLFTTISAESTDPNHPAHEYWTARYEEVLERWRGVIESAQREGSIDPDVDADMATRLVVAALDGLNIQWLLGTTEEMRSPIAYLLAALVPPSQSSRTNTDENPNRVKSQQGGAGKPKAKSQRKSKAALGRLPLR
jgi:AcrR family transcriptional regulator